MKILFGKDFVVQFIVYMVLKPLMISSAQDWQKLSGEVWRAYKYGEKQESKKSTPVSPTSEEIQPSDS